MSAAMWSEPTEPAHGQLGELRIDREQLTARGEARVDVRTVLPVDLVPGDQVRDHGRLRTVKSVGRARDIGDLVVIDFDDGGEHLAVNADQPVIVWSQQ